MLTKLIMALLSGIVCLYLLFCLLLNAPIMGGGNVKEISSDVKRRWFWVMSVYIGKATVVVIILAIVVFISYVMLYGFR